MELWIRNQDKTLLAKVDRIVLEDFDNCKPKIYSNDDFLGEYATKERALEVLDEIQGILNVKENLQFNGVDINDVFKDMDKEKVRLMLYQMSVYEMPLD